MNSPRAAIQTPALYNQSASTRRLILASFWLVIIIAIPLWWSATSIERLSLPSSLVLSEADKQLEFPISINVDASLVGRDSGIVSKLRRLIERHISEQPSRWSGLRVQLNEGPNASGMPELPTGQIVDL
jgi:phosphatidylinositol glycan class S